MTEAMAFGQLLDSLIRFPWCAIRAETSATRGLYGFVNVIIILEKRIIHPSF